MKFCNKCGTKIKEGVKFCNKCGAKIKFEEVVESKIKPKKVEPKIKSKEVIKKSDKSWLISVIPIIIIVILVFSYVSYYNRSLEEEREQEEAKLSEAKRKQALLDEEFQRQLQEREAQIQQEQEAVQYKDEDGDGLTYPEEVKLGTSDHDVDSDADGLRDNVDDHPAGGDELYKITVDWYHNGLPFQTQFGVPEDWYLHYKKQPRGYCCEGWKNFVTPNDITIKNIAADIADVSLTTGNPCRHCIAIDFVQSMIYEYDIDYIGANEYPKYPIETIKDEKGDCEDTSFLMASILEALGIDVILFDLPRHMAVGVECSDCTGAYSTYRGKRYYFLETTGAPGSWQIGRTSYDLANELEGIIDV